jgi:hypothetical protein
LREALAVLVSETEQAARYVLACTQVGKPAADIHAEYFDMGARAFREMSTKHECLAFSSPEAEGGSNNQHPGSLERTVSV